MFPSLSVLHRRSELMRHRVGLILPSKSIFLEPFLYRVSPPLLTFHSTRVLLRETSPEAVAEMHQGIECASRLIQEVSPHAVLFACASGSFVKGAGFDQEIQAGIEKITGAPTLVASLTMVVALKYLNVKRVALATAYIDRVTDLEVKFLEENGITVVSSKGLGLSGAAIREQEPETISKLILEVDRPEAQGIFVSCANLRAHEILDDMEQRLSKPVLSTNQTLLWHLLMTLKYNTPIKGLGCLLEKL
jgi:maleate isomerase